MIKNGLIVAEKIGLANFETHLIPKNNKTSRPQIKMNPRYITIHNTGNSKADALSNSKYVDTAAGYVSWHFTVDDKNIYQELPINETAWHAGDGSGPGNMTSIGIEICEHVGQDWNKAKYNAIMLIVLLMKDLNIPIDNVVPHQKWSGKYCPRVILNEGWSLFINLVKKEFKPMKWEQIIESHTDNPVEWKKGINSLVRIAKDDSTLGDLEIFKFLPALIEKIYNR